MLAIYLIVAILIIAGSFYYAGQWEHDRNSYQFFDRQSQIVISGLWVGGLWPVVLFLTIILGPFVGLYYLGERKKTKAKNAAKKENLQG